MRFRLAHLLLISTAVCIAFAFPAWFSPVELLLFASLLVVVALNIERRTAANYRASDMQFATFLVQRAMVGGLVAAIVFFGFTTLLLAIIPSDSFIDVEEMFSRSISFWVLFGACVAVGYHLVRRHTAGKVD